MEIKMGLKTICLAAVFVWAGSGTFAQEEEGSAEASPCGTIVQKALDYLAKAQNKHGSWDTLGITGIPAGGQKVGITSIAMLALLAEGSTAEKGKYGKNIRSGLDFILGSSRKDGAIIYLKDTSDPIWNTDVQDMHTEEQTALAVTALLDIYSKTNDENTKEKIKEAVEGAINFFEKRQLKTGGWDYSVAHNWPRPSNYVPTHGTLCDFYSIIPALVAAGNREFDVRKNMIERAEAALVTCIADDGSFRYGVSGEHELADKITGRRYFRTIAAIGTLRMAGGTISAGIKKAEKFLDIEHQKKFLQYEIALSDKHVAFGFLFATIGVAGFDRGIRKSWQGLCENMLINTQSEDGSWGHGAPYTPYFTAVAALVLQLPLGNLNLLNKPGTGDGAH